MQILRFWARPEGRQGKPARVTGDRGACPSPWWEGDGVCVLTNAGTSKREQSR